MAKEKVLAKKVEELTPEQKNMIEKTVKFINEKANEMLYKGSEEIGEYLLKNFFNNDPKLASSKNPHKPVSYRELCKREDLALHPITLGTMVRVAAQERYFKDNKVDTSKLTYTHKAQLVKMEDDNKKIALINDAIKNKLSTREFAKKIAAARKLLLGGEEESIVEITDYIFDLREMIEDSFVNRISVDKEKLSKQSTKKRNKLRDTVIDVKDELEEQIKKIAKLCSDTISMIDEIDKEKESKKPIRGKRGKKTDATPVAPQ
jgi:hypothetical protein